MAFPMPAADWAPVGQALSSSPVAQGCGNGESDRTDWGQWTSTLPVPLEFSHFSGLSLATIHRYLKNGKLPFRQPGGPRTRILIAVDALDSPSGSGASTSLGGDTSVVEASPQKEADADKGAPLPGPRPKWTRLDNRRK